MQLIRDNLTLWTSEIQDEAEDDGTGVENIWSKFNIIYIEIIGSII